VCWNTSYNKVIFWGVGELIWLDNQNNDWKVLKLQRQTKPEFLESQM